MRLGYYSVGSAAGAREVVDGLDQYGLSAVWGAGLDALTDSVWRSCRKIHHASASTSQTKVTTPSVLRVCISSRQKRASVSFDEGSRG